MVPFLVVAFLISLVYMSGASLYRYSVHFLAFQGLLLFAIALFELKEVDTLHLILILVETFVIKAIFTPAFLQRVIRRSGGDKPDSHFSRGYLHVVVSILIIAGSFSVAHFMHDSHLEVKYFGTAISALLIGMYIAITHKDIVHHLVSYIIIENGIFLLSLALGNEFPVMVSAAILLDVFTTVLLMGLFLSKIQTTLQSTDSENLTELKD